MKTFIKSLFFDRYFVHKLKKANVSESYLHNLLLEGKITLKEYLRIGRELKTGSISK